MPANNQLYKQVVAITTDYLGPMAQRFIDGHILNHLHKQPKDLTYRDLDHIIDWSDVALACLTEDETIHAEYSARLRELNQENSQRHVS